jgi:hypothetical protein
MMLTDPAEASLHPGLALTPKSTLSLMSRAELSLVAVRVLTQSLIHPSKEPNRCKVEKLLHIPENTCV